MVEAVVPREVALDDPHDGRKQRLYKLLRPEGRSPFHSRANDQPAHLELLRGVSVRNLQPLEVGLRFREILRDVHLRWGAEVVGRVELPPDRNIYGVAVNPG